MNVVADTSVFGAWIFREEMFAAAAALIDLIAEGTTFVPQLFPIEFSNVILVAERKGRISPAYAVEQLSLVGELPLIVDAETSDRARHHIFPLARAERLTVYDATYLELALRLGADLATLDKDLAAAARRRGLTVLP